MAFSSDRLAQGAFVKAVAKLLVIQEQIMGLQMQLQEADADASRANEAALRELGFDESTAPDRVFEAQRRLLTEAIAEAGLPEGSLIAKSVVGQIDQAEAAYHEAVEQEGRALGGFQGPAL